MQPGGAAVVDEPVINEDAFDDDTDSENNVEDQPVIKDDASDDDSDSESDAEEELEDEVMDEPVINQDAFDNDSHSESDPKEELRLVDKKDAKSMKKSEKMLAKAATVSTEHAPPGGEARPKVTRTYKDAKKTAAKANKPAAKAKTDAAKIAEKMSKMIECDTIVLDLKRKAEEAPPQQLIPKKSKPEPEPELDDQYSQTVYAISSGSDTPPPRDPMDKLETLVQVAEETEAYMVIQRRDVPRTPGRDHWECAHLYDEDGFDEEGYDKTGRDGMRLNRYGFCHDANRVGKFCDR